MDVRRAVEDDWQASRAIRLYALQDAPLAFASTYAREVSSGEDVWRSRIADSAQFLAFDGEAVVGTATGFVDPAEPTAVRLVAMFVVPEARRHGHAARLLEAVVADARERGFERVVLHVVDTNTAARSCYLGHGFSPTGRTMPLPHAPEFTETEMELKLR